MSVKFVQCLVDGPGHPVSEPPRRAGHPVSKRGEAPIVRQSGVLTLIEASPASLQRLSAAAAGVPMREGRVAALLAAASVTDEMKWAGDSAAHGAWAHGASCARMKWRETHDAIGG